MNESDKRNIMHLMEDAERNLTYALEVAGIAEDYNPQLVELLFAARDYIADAGIMLNKKEI